MWVQWVVITGTWGDHSNRPDVGGLVTSLSAATWIWWSNVGLSLVIVGQIPQCHSSPCVMVGLTVLQSWALIRGCRVLMAPLLWVHTPGSGEERGDRSPAFVVGDHVVTADPPDPSLTSTPFHTDNPSLTTYSSTVYLPWWKHYLGKYLVQKGAREGSRFISGLFLKQMTEGQMSWPSACTNTRLWCSHNLFKCTKEANSSKATVLWFIGLRIFSVNMFIREEVK